MKATSAVVTVLALSLVPSSTATPQSRPVIRAYGRVGYLLASPNTADLGYSVDGIPGGLDDQQDVEQLTYGVGVQLLKETKPGVSIGGELGVERAFSSKITGDVTSVIIYSNDYDSEWEVLVNGLLELSKGDSPAFIQVGVGPRIVFWRWKYEFSSIYSTEHDSGNGNEVSWGATGALGTRLQLGSSMKIPAAIRADIDLRYGVFARIGFVTGVEF